MVLAAASACALNFLIVYFGFRSSGSAAVEDERVSAAVQNLYGHRNLPGQHWHSHGKMDMEAYMDWGVAGGGVESTSWFVGIVLMVCW